MGEKKPAAVKSVQPPKGTRDLYPEDALRRRYITQTWRDAAIRCGFDEIEGPTLESSDLYSIKSGEGILSELFQVYSGKSDKEIEQVRETGRAPYAMRPEFTPTLARMYAAHAKQLPKPCKWFTAGPYFRAERPQRGRLREFLQWNVDIIGDDNTTVGRTNADAEIIEVSVAVLRDFGFDTGNPVIAYNDRRMTEAVLAECGVQKIDLEKWYNWIDRAPKNPKAALIQLHEWGVEDVVIDFLIGFLWSTDTPKDFALAMRTNPDLAERVLEFKQKLDSKPSVADANADATRLRDTLNHRALRGWSAKSNSIVRGLAYYTGLVFELLADGERAVAGGGRYDNLIELMGGPPTPAVGFAMGDVVLANLLDDHGLFPQGAELMDAVSRPPASVRPDAFVVPNGDEANEPLAHQLTSQLRRGVESEDWLSRDERKPWNPDRYRVSPLHARITYKSTRNLKKLRADAEKQHARFLVEIHGPDKVELTDMDQREAITSDIGSFNTDPASPHYVGRAIAERTR